MTSVAAFWGMHFVAAVLVGCKASAAGMSPIERDELDHKTGPETEVSECGIAAEGSRPKDRRVERWLKVSMRQAVAGRRHRVPVVVVAAGSEVVGGRIAVAHAHWQAKSAACLTLARPCCDLYSTLSRQPSRLRPSTMFKASMMKILGIVVYASIQWAWLKVKVQGHLHFSSVEPGRPKPLPLPDFATNYSRSNAP